MIAAIEPVFRPTTGMRHDAGIAFPGRLNAGIPLV